MNPRYQTHEDMLKAVCDVVPNGGTVVEFGCGDSSTPMLHERYEHLRIVTIENRLEWLLRWSHLASKWHQFVFCVHPLDCLWIAKGADVVFVDCDPGDARAAIVQEARHSVGVVVAHDTQPDCAPAYAWGNCFDGWEYGAVDNRQKPWTTAVSDAVDVRALCGFIYSR